MTKEPEIIDLEPHEWESDTKPFCYQRTTAYAVTVLVLAYPVHWVVSRVVPVVLEPVFRMLGL